MSAKAILEVDGKRLLNKHVRDAAGQPLLHSLCVEVRRARPRALAPVTPTVLTMCVCWCQVTAETDLAALAETHPWLLTGPLVAKPDQLIKRRGKLGLVLLNADWAAAQAWIRARLGQPMDAGTVTGIARRFVVEPFVPHTPADEYYVCIQAGREGDEVLFYHEGGVDVGDVDSKAQRLLVPVGATLDAAAVTPALLVHVPEARRPLLAAFVHGLYGAFVALQCTYLEINPLVVVGDRVHCLDLAAKLDQAADFECSKLWGPITFPAPFGRESFPEEAYIADLDGKTGASLKLTILNPRGRIWTMVAGGGASVVYRCVHTRAHLCGHVRGQGWVCAKKTRDPYGPHSLSMCMYVCAAQ
jgi:ATP citrate (pro-S)-lyase